VKQGERLGAKIEEGDRTWEVTFDTTGKPGGHINIAEPGRVVMDDELVTRVEDNYDRWKTDPRYNDWMTNEFMRAVIFPYGKKPETRNQKPD